MKNGLTRENPQEWSKNLSGSSKIQIMLTTITFRIGSGIPVALGLLFLGALSIFRSGISMAQTGSGALTLEGRIWFPSRISVSGDTTGGSDCWGYTAPDGTEYALMGVRDGIAVVNATTLQTITVVPGPQNGNIYYHRDIKTFRNYAYAVSEMSGENEGLMIMDLQYLTDSVRFVKSYKTSTDARSHNFSIDISRSHAYILRSNYSGCRVVSLRDPENPVDVGSISTPGIHDVFARNDLLFVAEGRAGTFSIWDMANKTMPVLLARTPIPSSGYVHSVWPTDDGAYLLTTEETSGKTVKVWDIRDLTNINLVGEYLGDNQLAHNVHVKGRFAYISHYTLGVTVVDLFNPSEPIEVARYDTYPQNDQSGFSGCFGAYPFTTNGYVYASDIEGYLTILRFDPPIVTSRDGPPIGVPSAFRLEQNYPNPFNPSTTIRYELSSRTDVVLKIFDLLGQEVATLVDEEKSAGRYEVSWDAGRIASGMYFYRLSVVPVAPRDLVPTSRDGQARDFVQTKKLVLMK